MIQGTGSNVGKSVVVSGLCRALTNRGFSVRPFKPQNMSNNAAVVGDGFEIGRAQHLQALACRIEPGVHMNPVLLKPETGGSQVVVQGKTLTSTRVEGYRSLKEKLLPAVMDSFCRIIEDCDIVLVEGAGSASEVNLRQNDFANMGFARAAGLPVMLLGNIELGGVIAQLVGTHAVLEKEDKKLITGYAVNKFHGDPKLFNDGLRIIEEFTGWQGLGVIPWMNETRFLPSEDAQDLGHFSSSSGKSRVVCLTLPRIANFDDLDPLALEPEVSLQMLRPGKPIPGDTDVVIIPGSKSTIEDLKVLRNEGWDIDIAAHLRRGGKVLGICGGFQILGKWIFDPECIESTSSEFPGLGILDVSTVLHPTKRVGEVTARLHGDHHTFHAYEIHLGKTSGPDMRRPFAYILADSGERPDGAISENGQVIGTYLHGLFSNDHLRRKWLSQFGCNSDLGYSEGVDRALDSIADKLTHHLDLDLLLDMMVELDPETINNSIL